jgi:hypothetical protein
LLGHVPYFLTEFKAAFDTVPGEVLALFGQAARPAEPASRAKAKTRSVA